MLRTLTDTLSRRIDKARRSEQQTLKLAGWLPKGMSLHRDNYLHPEPEPLHLKRCTLVMMFLALLILIHPRIRAVSATLERIPLTPRIITG